MGSLVLAIVAFILTYLAVKTLGRLAVDVASLIAAIAVALYLLTT